MYFDTLKNKNYHTSIGYILKNETICLNRTI